MTSDGINDEDWQRIRELAVDVVNASASGNDDVERSRLFEALDALERNYGRLPSIVATRADFVESPPEAVSLLTEAFALATAMDDAANEMHIADSLAHACIDDLRDIQEGRRWLDVLAGCLRRVGGETDIKGYEALEARWADLARR
jgi:hypothetical protein